MDRLEMLLDLSMDPLEMLLDLRMDPLQMLLVYILLAELLELMMAEALD